jgi:prepilin-type N-terminal cleavage/methylation domain-containing protein
LTNSNLSQSRLTSNGNRRCDGFSLLEIAITIAIVLSLLGYGIPKMQTALYVYQLDAAADACAWAIESTRYQAIQMGYPYQIAINASNNTYQVLTDPTYPVSTTFTNLGNVQPIVPTAVTMNTSNTIQFSPSGLVTAASGSTLSFTITYKGLTKTISVTSYGSVKMQ